MNQIINTQDKKFCKDCTYFSEPFKSRPRCQRPNAPREDLVYGDHQRCEDARTNLLANNCGVEAIYFTAKPDIQTNTPA